MAYHAYFVTAKAYFHIQYTTLMEKSTDFVDIEKIKAGNLHCDFCCAQSNSPILAA